MSVYAIPVQRNPDEVIFNPHPIRTQGSYAGRHYVVFRHQHRTDEYYQEGIDCSYKILSVSVDSLRTAPGSRAMHHVEPLYAYVMTNTRSASIEVFIVARTDGYLDNKNVMSTVLGTTLHITDDYRGSKNVTNPALGIDLHITDGVTCHIRDGNVQSARKLRTSSVGHALLKRAKRARSRLT